MTEDHPKFNKAFRNIKVVIEAEYNWNDHIDLNIIPMEFDYDDEKVELTKKQQVEISEQIFAKIGKMKITLSKTIRCPNCRDGMNETEVKGQFLCEGCNCKVKMEFMGGKK